VDGRALTFHLAGINNQNFLMRDEETGSYWQQISGRAIAGPLRGRQLQLVPSEEVTFGLWKEEHGNGTVLSSVAKFAKEYDPKGWEKDYAKLPVVTPRLKSEPLEARRLVLGVNAFGASRAFPLDKLLEQKLVLDRVGSEPVLLAVGPDKLSIRVFRRRLPGVDEAPDFYRNESGVMMDSVSGSEWGFTGCAVKGEKAGACLEPVYAIRDYWFDWRTYHPETSVYSK
jgi:hypothetical protein